MILVTGSTGLVGSYLLYELTRSGQNVRALYRSQKTRCAPVDIFKNLTDHPAELLSRIEWVDCDVLDVYGLDQAMQGITRVYHCAAIVSFDPRQKKQLLQTNIGGTENVVNACLRHGVEKLAYVSSIAALGEPESGQLIDETAKWATSGKNSVYAISKYGGEREVWRGIEEGLNAVIVNPSVILGAGSHPRAVNSLLYGIHELTRFYTNGVTGYVDVKDVVGALILLMNSEVKNERFILSSENVSFREIVAAVAQIANKPKPGIPLNRHLLSLACGFDYLRSKLSGKKQLLTPDSIRSALAKTYYSSEKFKKQFSFEFIPVKESLRTTFEMLRKIKESN